MRKCDLSVIQCNQMRLLACEREAQDNFSSAPSNIKTQKTFQRFFLCSSNEQAFRIDESAADPTYLA